MSIDATPDYPLRRGLHGASASDAEEIREVLSSSTAESSPTLSAQSTLAERLDPPPPSAENLDDQQARLLHYLAAMDQGIHLLGSLNQASSASERANVLSQYEALMHQAEEQGLYAGGDEERKQDLQELHQRGLDWFQSVLEAVHNPSFALSHDLGLEEGGILGSLFEFSEVDLKSTMLLAKNKEGFEHVEKLFSAAGAAMTSLRALGTLTGAASLIARKQLLTAMSDKSSQMLQYISEAEKNPKLIQNHLSQIFANAPDVESFFQKIESLGVTRQEVEALLSKRSTGISLPLTASSLAQKAVFEVIGECYLTSLKTRTLDLQAELVKVRSEVHEQAIDIAGSLGGEASSIAHAAIALAHKVSHISFGASSLLGSTVQLAISIQEFKEAKEQEEQMASFEESAKAGAFTVKIEKGKAPSAKEFYEQCVDKRVSQALLLLVKKSSFATRSPVIDFLELESKMKLLGIDYQQFKKDLGTFSLHRHKDLQSSEVRAALAKQFKVKEQENLNPMQRALARHKAVQQSFMKRYAPAFQKVVDSLQESTLTGADWEKQWQESLYQAFGLRLDAHEIRTLLESRKIAAIEGGEVVKSITKQSIQIPAVQQFLLQHIASRKEGMNTAIRNALRVVQEKKVEIEKSTNWWNKLKSKVNIGLSSLSVIGGIALVVGGIVGVSVVSGITFLSFGILGVGIGLALAGVYYTYKKSPRAFSALVSAERFKTSYMKLGLASKRYETLRADHARRVHKGRAQTHRLNMRLMKLKRWAGYLKDHPPAQDQGGLRDLAVQEIKVMEQLYGIDLLVTNSKGEVHVKELALETVIQSEEKKIYDEMKAAVGQVEKHAWLSHGLRSSFRAFVHHLTNEKRNVAQEAEQVIQRASLAKERGESIAAQKDILITSLAGALISTSSLDEILQPVIDSKDQKNGLRLLARQLQGKGFSRNQIRSLLQDPRFISKFRENSDLSRPDVQMVIIEKLSPHLLHMTNQQLTPLLKRLQDGEKVDSFRFKIDLLQSYSKLALEAQIQADKKATNFDSKSLRVAQFEQQVNDRRYQDYMQTIGWDVRSKRIQKIAGHAAKELALLIQKMPDSQKFSASREVKTILEQAGIKNVGAFFAVYEEQLRETNKQSLSKEELTVGHLKKQGSLVTDHFTFCLEKLLVRKEKEASFQSLKKQLETELTGKYERVFASIQKAKTVGELKKSMDKEGIDLATLHREIGKMDQQVKNLSPKEEKFLKELQQGIERQSTIRAGVMSQALSVLISQKKDGVLLASFSQVRKGLLAVPTDMRISIYNHPFTNEDFVRKWQDSYVGVENYAEIFQHLPEALFQQVQAGDLDAETTSFLKTTMGIDLSAKHLKEKEVRHHLRAFIHSDYEEFTHLLKGAANRQALASFA